MGQNRYGIGAGSSWFSIPLTVGKTKFNLTVSTSLLRTWVPSVAVCASAANKTTCEEPLGGLYPPPPPLDGNAVEITAELKEHVYTNSSVAAALVPGAKNDPKTLLALQGAGVLARDTMTLRSEHGDEVALSAEQSVGIFTQKPNFNGWLSLPQLAWSLFRESRTPGPNFHLLLGEAAVSNGSSTPDTSGWDSGSYVLVFGGYDRAVWDLNATQQYALRASEKTDVGGAGKDGGAGYSMEAPLVDLVYRRKDDSDDTATSLLDSAAATAIVDTTTPFLWLPPRALDSLVAATGAKWNATMDSYVWTRCFTDCSPAEDSTSGAVLEFRFASQTVTLDFARFFKLQSLWYEELWSENRPVFPVRALARDDPPVVVLGRAAMAGIHLWVDFAEQHFSLLASNTSSTSSRPSEIVAWGSDHPPITNSSILAAPLPDSSSSASNTGSGSGSKSGPGSKKPSMGIIAGGAAAGVAVLATAAFGMFWWRRRRQRPGPRRPITWPAGPSELPPGEAGVSADQKSPYYPLYEAPNNQHSSAALVRPDQAVLPGHAKDSYTYYEMHAPQKTYEMAGQQQPVYNPNIGGADGHHATQPGVYEMPNTETWGRR